MAIDIKQVFIIKDIDIQLIQFKIFSWPDLNNVPHMTLGLIR